jgi:transposase
VIAPTLVPVKAGDRVKTDRRDAENLARCYRAGELTAVWVPDAAHEALRDLVRAREAAKKDQLRHRHRLGKFLLRHGKRPVDAGEAWTKKYLNWIRIHARFDQPALEATVSHYLHEVEHVAERITKLEKAIDEAVAQAAPEVRAVIEALQALRGVAQTTAATVVCELGSLARFPSPGQLMGYSGLVPREYSSGNRIQRGPITKTGNAHLRRVLVESAWTYQHRPNVQGRVLRRQKALALSDEAKRIAWKAQERLHKRFTAMTGRGKERGKIVTALARELLGFMWAIAVHTEGQFKMTTKAA